MATTTSRPGVSLAKGPIAIVGILGLVYGLSGLIFASHHFPLHGIPHDPAHGRLWISLLVNGWTEALFAGAGLVLLLFAGGHTSSKSMAMLVGLILIAAAVIAIIRGNGVFGIFAANRRTEIVWAAAGVVLIVLSLLPRVGRRQAAPTTTTTAPAATRRATPVTAAPVAAPATVRPAPAASSPTPTPTPSPPAPATAPTTPTAAADDSPRFDEQPTVSQPVTPASPPADSTDPSETETRVVPPGESATPGTP